MMQEVCPNCGEYVESLDDETGWCNSCAGVVSAPLCRVCGKPGYYICSHCKQIEWLVRNADAIERTMATYGVKASKAKQFVTRDNRPRCHLCRKPIKGGVKGKHIFCRTSASCCKANRVYYYHKKVARRSHEESVQKALVAVYVSTLTSKVTQLG